MDYQVIENGQLSFEFTNINTMQLFEQCYILHKSQIQARNLTYIMEISESVPEQVRSDPDRVKQVVRNLLQNALKNTYTGSITLKVERY